MRPSRGHHLDLPAPRCPRPWCQGTSTLKAISHPSILWPTVPTDRRNSRAGVVGDGNRKGFLLLPHFELLCNNKLTRGTEGIGSQSEALNQSCRRTACAFKAGLAERAGWSTGSRAHPPRSEFWLHNSVFVRPWARECSTVDTCFLVCESVVGYRGEQVTQCMCRAESSPWRPTGESSNGY